MAETWRKETRLTPEVVQGFDLEDPDDRAVLSDLMEDQGDPELAVQIDLLRNPPPDEHLFILEGAVTTARIASEGTDVDAFLRGYLDAAVWTGTVYSQADDGSGTGDRDLEGLGFTADDIPADQVALVRPECEDFCAENGWRFIGHEDQAGQDYFLTSGGWTNAFVERQNLYGRDHAGELDFAVNGHGWSLGLNGYYEELDGDNPPGLVFQRN